MSHHIITPDDAARYALYFVSREDIFPYFKMFVQDEARTQDGMVWSRALSLYLVRTYARILKDLHKDRELLPCS